MQIEVLDIGLKPYAEALRLQEKLFTENLQAKEENRATSPYLILCEHPPVFTLGKSGKRENILVSDEALHAELYRVNRGGDVTFHGPGQLVAYPILDVDRLGLGIAEYIFRLEEAIICSLSNYQIRGERITGAAGIWVRHAESKDEKIAAIGVKASRHITMHGTAINLNTDLSYFAKIVPCGLTGKGVTSIQKETGHPADMNLYKSRFVQTFTQVFGLDSKATTNHLP